MSGLFTAALSDNQVRSLANRGYNFGDNLGDSLNIIEGFDVYDAVEGNP